MSDQQDCCNVGQREYKAAKPRDCIEFIGHISAVLKLAAPLYAEFRGIITPIAIEWTWVSKLIGRPLAPVIGHDAPVRRTQLATTTWSRGVQFAKCTPPEKKVEQFN